MRKSILTILVCNFFCLSLTGCDNENLEKEKADIHTFNATITECETKYMIVKPDETEAVYRSADLIRVEFVDGYNSCKVNDRVKITYEGYINEIYPAQIGTTKIETLK